MINREKKFKIATLGCRTNQYESHAYHNQLMEIGYSEALGKDEADLCVINTCTVTASADSHSRQQIRQLARAHPKAKIVVTGCSTVKDKEAYEAMSEVSLVVPDMKKENLISSLFPDAEVPEFSIERFPGHTRAFVKIQDGCNSFCTYCIIPYVRGRSRSRDIPSIIQEIETLVANGYREIVLTGINIGDFDGGKEGEERPDTLADLLRLVDPIPGLERIRISSIDPDEVDDDLIAAIISSKKACLSMHLVLQSGSNVILKRMNRKYTRQIFWETYDRLQRASADFTLTTDVIVGFPGETEADFEETLAVMREVNFAKVHMFPYSPRPRTRAALYPNKVSPEIIKERKHRLLQLAEKNSFDLREQFIGRTMTILTEEKQNNTTVGHTDNFLMVHIPDSDLGSNEFVEVELIENSPVALIGRVVSQKLCKAS